MFACAAGFGLLSPSFRRRPESSGVDLWLCDNVRLLAYAAGVPSVCRRPGHFSLLAQRKVTQRKGSPSRRFADFVRKVRGGITGFFDSTSCADEKRAGIPASSPSG